MYDLSLVLPSIYPERIQSVYTDIENNLGPVDSKHHEDIKWELIVVSPYELDTPLKEKSNFTVIQDYGNPTRCVQLASLIARGTLFTWLSDDCTIIEKNLRALVHNFLQRGQYDCEYIV